MSKYICTQCFEGICTHDDYPCPNTWTDSVCGCKRVKVHRSCYYGDELIPCSKYNPSLVAKEHDTWDKFDHRNHEERPMSMSDYDSFNPAPVGATKSFAEKANNFLGIDPDYANKIPEPKAFTPVALIAKLSVEQMPWEDGGWSITQTSRWQWEIDFVQYLPTAYQLSRGDTVIGFLKEYFVENGARFTEPHFEGFEPYSEATVYDIRFLRECTGWTIII